MIKWYIINNEYDSIFEINFYCDDVILIMWCYDEMKDGLFKLLWKNKNNKGEIF